MKKTKIICSIGPACANIDVMTDMVLNGMDCARINLSHSSLDAIPEIIELIRSVRTNSGIPIAIMYDTKGPEFRTLNFQNGGISIKTGETIKLQKKKCLGNKDKFSVNHPEAIDKLKVGNHVLIDNALLDLEVIKKVFTMQSLTRRIGLVVTWLSAQRTISQRFISMAIE